MHQLLSASALAALALSACAAPEGPVVPVPPTLEFAGLESTRITPDAIQFVGTVVVKNRMRGTVGLERVDYGAALHDAMLFTDSHAEFEPMHSRETHTLTLPFQIVMRDILDRVENVLGEECVRVQLRGTVVPEGFAPLEFTATKVVPLPRLPRLRFAGSRGNPLDGEFTVLVDVENTNRFPMSSGEVETFLTLNGTRYDLLHSHSCGTLPPGGRGRMELTMHGTRGKGLGMIVGVIRNQSLDFTVGGSIAFATPHGVFELPVEFGSAAAPAR